MHKRIAAALAFGAVIALSTASAQGSSTWKWVDFQDWGPIEFCGFSCDPPETCCFIRVDET